MTTKQQQHTETLAQYSAYQALFEYYNNALFEGKLQNVILTFSRKTKTFGFYISEKWKDESGDVVAEIALNPFYLSKREPKQTVSTLVHEMCHHWQFSLGNPGRPAYHNAEFSEKMESIGLITSNTGEPDGKRVGQKMSHYIQDGGPFEKAFESMPEEIWLPWTMLPDPEKEKKPKKESKVKYTCPTCEANVWGKEGLHILCQDDDSLFTTDG